MPIVLRFLLISMISFSLPLTHAEDMTWVVLTLPSAGSQQGEKPVEAFIYNAQKLLEEQLPEFTHLHEKSTHKRLDRDLASARPVCSTVTLEHPERRKSGYFVVYLPATPMELVIRKALLPALVLGDGKVSLTQILKTGLKGGISSTRGYPPELENLLQAGIESGKIEIVNTSSPGVNLLTMIAHERIDYTFEFPMATTELSKAANWSTLLVSLPIEENQRLIPAGIYCSRTNWGLRMALRINAAIQRLARTPERLLQLYSEGQRAVYETSLRDFFRTRINASPAY